MFRARSGVGTGRSVFEKVTVTGLLSAEGYELILQAGSHSLPASVCLSVRCKGIPKACSLLLFWKQGPARGFGSDVSLVRDPWF